MAGGVAALVAIMAKARLDTSELLKVPKIAEAIKLRRRDLLKLLGMRLLSENRKDFQKKSNGGVGLDGIKWKPLAESTIARKSRRGKRNAKRKTTAGGIARPTAGAVIGVDTGLLRASSQPGFAKTATKGGTTRRATNVFIASQSAVTVGYAREYADYFDAERKLLPEKLPPGYVKALDETAQRFLDKITREVLGK